MNQGAICAAGFKYTITAVDYPWWKAWAPVVPGNLWANYYAQHLITGWSVGNSLKHASDDLYTWSGNRTHWSYDQWIYAGNGSTTY